MEPIRLNKYLAACGICSRRDADKLIEQGAVMVGGRPAVQGMKVTDEDEIFVHGKRIAERDAHAEKIVVEEIRYPVRVTYAGRLDKDSEGLLLMTNDGDLIDAMMRGANHHEKEYIVKTERAWTEEALVHMRQGVYLEELKVTTRPCEIEQLGPKTIRMVLTQGLNRQIRRMCKTQGYEVSALRRTRVMNVELGSLHSGEYRELTKDEMRSLYEECGLLEMRQHTFRT